MPPLRALWNAFAAALLMPEGLLREAVGAGFGQSEFAQLAMKLMVSPSSLAYRLESLRLIDAMARDQWRAMSAKQAARISGASAALAAATTRFE